MYKKTNSSDLQRKTEKKFENQTIKTGSKIFVPAVHFERYFIYDYFIRDKKNFKSKTNKKKI